MKVAELGSQQTVFNPLQNRLKMKKAQVVFFGNNKAEEAKDVLKQANAIINKIYSTTILNKDRLKELGDELKKVCENADESQLLILQNLLSTRIYKKQDANPPEKPKKLGELKNKITSMAFVPLVLLNFISLGSVYKIIGYGLLAKEVLQGKEDKKNAINQGLDVINSRLDNIFRYNRSHCQELYRKYEEEKNKK